MSTKEKLEKYLSTLVDKLAMPVVGIILEYPSNPNHGDYSTNIAMRSTQAPLDIAQKLVQTINKSKPDFLEKVEIAPPGFINFWVSKDFLIEQVEEVLKQAERFGSSSRLRKSNGEPRKIMVEYTDPNPFKEFHIGHLYSNAVGESLSRLFESQGANVWRVNYQGDIGLHVAKAIWGLQKMMNDEGLKINELEKKPLEERVRFMGEAYALGSKIYEENEEAKEKIHEINKKIYDKSDPEIKNLYEKGKAWSLEYFETLYKRLGTQFTHYYFESEAGKIGVEIVRNHIKDGIFEESEGAVIFRGEKYGLHNRVFINSQGLPTYEAKELGLAPTKYKDFQYDQSIIVTGNEINAYFQVLLKVLSLVDAALALKTKHIGHGMVRLPQGKMSSRTGSVITGEWLLDEAKRRIEAQYKEMDSKTSEQVALGAVKYALLRSSIGRDITFDFDASISLEGDSGPYIQYTYARTQSVLRKSQIRRASRTNVKSQINTNQELEIEELGLLRTIHRFSEVVREAAERLSPNTLSSYLFDLSQKFNLFYQKHAIIGSKKMQFRLLLTAAAGQVLKNGLYLLGIEAPERM